MSRRVRFKVCCIADPAEAALAVRYGAAALGLVSRMPSGPGVVDDATIGDVARGVPPGVARFLLTSETDPDAIADQQRRLGVDVLQLVDRVEPDVLRALRAALPGVRLVAVVHVTGRPSLDEAVALAPLVDALLLDSGNPDLAVKELGGTGRTHDWEVSAAIVDAVRVPVWLAGGLNPENVAAAAARVRPFGVDVCSGLRTDGRLDEGKLRAFATALDAVRGVE
ncbi:MAG: phosphoribosylanthranilate isomerase [Planctomycetota bacterium JB042]